MNMLRRSIRHSSKLTLAVFLTVICLAGSSCQNQTAETQVVKPTSKYLVIDSQRVPAARCEVTDEEGGTWSVAETPETIDVTKAKGLLSITCYKSGFKPTTIETSTNKNKITIWMEPSTWSSKQQMEVWQDAKEAYEKGL